MPLDYSQQTDGELVQLAQQRGAKDDRAFQELVQRYENYVYQQCYRMFGNAQDAEDMSQEVFFKAYRGLAGFALALGLGGRDIARNVLASYYIREQYKLGEKIIVDGQEGTLDAVGAVNSEISVENGRIIVPNTHLTESATKILD